LNKASFNEVWPGLQSIWGVYAGLNIIQKAIDYSAATILHQQNNSAMSQEFEGEKEGDNIKQ